MASLNEGERGWRCVVFIDPSVDVGVSGEHGCWRKGGALTCVSHFLILITNPVGNNIQH